MKYQAPFRKQVRELIDTLWNVNFLLKNYFSFVFIRINRYIMECKCIYAFNVSFCDAELIDTLWNVNLITAITCPDSAKN